MPSLKQKRWDRNVWLRGIRKEIVEMRAAINALPVAEAREAALKGLQNFADVYFPELRFDVEAV